MAKTPPTRGSVTTRTPALGRPIQASNAGIATPSVPPVATKPGVGDARIPIPPGELSLPPQFQGGPDGPLTLPPAVTEIGDRYIGRYWLYSQRWELLSPLGRQDGQDFGGRRLRIVVADNPEGRDTKLALIRSVDGLDRNRLDIRIDPRWPDSPVFQFDLCPADFDYIVMNLRRWMDEQCTATFWIGRQSKTELPWGFEFTQYPPPWSRAF